MNRPILYLAGILLLGFQSCQSQQENNTSVASQTASSETEVLALSQEDPAAEPIHITKAGFLENVMNYELNTEEWIYEGDLPCIVDFYATWCPPCKVSDPILEELADEYAGKINIYKVDVDSEQELAALFGIQSIPSFLFCPVEGNPTMSSGIAQTPEATKAMFKQQIETILLKTTASVE